MPISPCQVLQVALPLSMAWLSGLSACFSLWIIPMLHLPAAPPRAKAAEHVRLFTLGGRYLQPSSRIMGIALLSTTFWTYLRGDEVWKYYALCFAILAPTAVWEVCMIFPINDKVVEMDARMQKGGDEALSTAEQKHLDTLLDRWSLMHTYRYVAPGVAAIISTVALQR